MIDIVAIGGSPSAISRSAGTLALAQDLAETRGLRSRAIHIRDLPLAEVALGQADHPAIQASAALLAEARGVIIATPIYKAAYSGLLKAYLDLLPQNALAGKVIFPIATGGSPAHTLAIDYALIPVLMALGATHMLRGLYVLDAQASWDVTGALRLDPAIAERLTRGVGELAQALKEPLPA